MCCRLCCLFIPSGLTDNDDQHCTAVCGSLVSLFCPSTWVASSSFIFLAHKEQKDEDNKTVKRRRTTYHHYPVAGPPARSGSVAHLSANELAYRGEPYHTQLHTRLNT